MKIAVVSDSHGNKRAIDQIFKNYEFDHLIFLGDGIEDLGEYKYLDNVHIVRGNCDFFSDMPDQKILQLGGLCIFATHGHKYMVKFSRGILANEASKLDAQIALYGHTHKANDEYVNGVRLINPGALKNNQFMMLDKDGEQIKINSVFL